LAAVAILVKGGSRPTKPVDALPNPADDGIEYDIDLLGEFIQSTALSCAATQRGAIDGFYV